MRLIFRILASTPLSRVVAVSLVVIATLGTLGAIRAGTSASSWLLTQIDLDAELNIPSFWSAALLGGAALAALGNARWGSIMRAPWAMLGVLFAFMSGDEVVQLHERLEYATGHNWQIFYAPVMLVGAAAWVRIVSREPRRVVRGSLLAGAGAWTGAQVLEWLWWNGHLALRWESVPEEILEMLGSLAFLTAGLAALQALAAGQLKGSVVQTARGPGSARRRTPGQRPPAARSPDG
jgi:hypothetical protein